MKNTFNRSTIMTRANALRKAYNMSKSEALTKSWAMAKLEILQSEKFVLNCKNLTTREDDRRINELIKAIAALKNKIYPRVKETGRVLKWNVSPLAYNRAKANADEAAEKHGTDSEIYISLKNKVDAMFDTYESEVLNETAYNAVA